MRLKRLEISNFCQHGSLTVEFEGNLIGLVGGMGTGKSNLLKALCFAITGVVAKKSKSKLLRWGAKKGEVSLEFEHNGKDGIISRLLHKSSASIQYGDDEVDGITDVDQYIQKTLGVDQKVWMNAVFVDQTALTDILFSQPAQRRLEWQKLIGLADVAKIHDSMGAVINNIERPSNNRELIEYTAELKAKAEEEVLLLSGEITELSKELTIVNPLEELNKISSERQQAATLEQLTAVKAKLVDAKTRADDAAARLNAVSAREGHPLEHVDSWIAGFEAQAAKMMTPEQREATSAQITTLTQEAAVCRAQIEESTKKVQHFEAQKSQDVSKHLEACRARNELEVKLQSLRSLQSATAEGFHETATCPLCEQAIEDPRKLLDSLMSRIKTTDTDLTAAMARENECKQQVQGFEATIKQHTDHIASLEISIRERELVITQSQTALKEASSDMPLEQVKANLEQWKEYRSALVAMDAQKATLQQESTTLQGYVTMFQKEESKLAAMLGTVTPRSEEELQQAEIAANTQMQTASAVAEKQALVQAAQKRITAADERIRALVKEAASTKSFDDTMQVLENVRSWFHHSAGPNKIVCSILEDLSVATNSFLEKFGAVYAVRPDFKNTSFNYFYTDHRVVHGHVAPIVDLSGGQKVQLAVSFRLASYCMFASRLGVLTLDEPTIWLDTPGVESFCHMLFNLKELATKMGLQVFISTHAESVKSCVDSLIDLGSDLKEKAS